METQKDEKYAIVGKVGDTYLIKIPKHPAGISNDIKSLYEQIEHLKGLGFVIIEDQEHPIHLDDLVN